MIFTSSLSITLSQAMSSSIRMRTDARALPEDYLPTVKDTLEALRQQNAYAGFAGQVLKGPAAR